MRAFRPSFPMLWLAGAAVALPMVAATAPFALPHRFFKEEPRESDPVRLGTGQIVIVPVPPPAPVDVAPAGIVHVPPPPVAAPADQPVPERPKGSIIVSVKDRRLYHRTADGRFATYPIAVARSPKLLRLGDTVITAKRTNPIWVPTPAMHRSNARLPQRVLPGPRNPLGSYALNLGWPAYAIHGTNKPASIGHAATSGCFRLRAPDIKALYHSVEVGTAVRVIEDSWTPPES